MASKLERGKQLLETGIAKFVKQQARTNVRPNVAAIIAKQGKRNLVPNFYNYVAKKFSKPVSFR